MDFTLISFDSLYPPVSLANSGDSGLPCDLTSITDLRKVVNFLVFSDFYLLLGQIIDF